MLTTASDLPAQAHNRHEMKGKLLHWCGHHNVLSRWQRQPWRPRYTGGETHSGSAATSCGIRLEIVPWTACMPDCLNGWQPMMIKRAPA